MSDKDQYKGFPCGGIDHLTKREIFAGQIMAAAVGGCISNPDQALPQWKTLAATSVACADALIKELNK